MRTPGFDRLRSRQGPHRSVRQGGAADRQSPPLRQLPLPSNQVYPRSTRCAFNACEGHSCLQARMLTRLPLYSRFQGFRFQGFRVSSKSGSGSGSGSIA
jgi:hypothetical protein